MAVEPREEFFFTAALGVLGVVLFVSVTISAIASYFEQRAREQTLRKVASVGDLITVSAKKTQVQVRWRGLAVDFTTTPHYAVADFVLLRENAAETLFYVLASRLVIVDYLVFLYETPASSDASDELFSPSKAVNTMQRLLFRYLVVGETFAKAELLSLLKGVATSLNKYNLSAGSEEGKVTAATEVAKVATLIVLALTESEDELPPPLVRLATVVYSVAQQASGDVKVAVELTKHVIGDFAFALVTQYTTELEPSKDARAVLQKIATVVHFGIAGTKFMTTESSGVEKAISLMSGTIEEELNKWILVSAKVGHTTSALQKLTIAAAVIDRAEASLLSLFCEENKAEFIDHVTARKNTALGIDFTTYMKIYELLSKSRNGERDEGLDEARVLLRAIKSVETPAASFAKAPSLSRRNSLLGPQMLAAGVGNGDGGQGPRPLPMVRLSSRNLPALAAGSDVAGGLGERDKGSKESGGVDSGRGTGGAVTSTPVARNVPIVAPVRPISPHAVDN